MPSTLETTNKELFARFHRAVNTGDPDVITAAIDELVDPDVELHTSLPVPEPGVRAFHYVWTLLLRAYPDIQVHIQDLIAEDDKVVARSVVTGTHRGEYLGQAPTGRTVTYNEIFIARIADGRIVETWGVVDVLAQLRQLGAITL
ncbi:ester cyclase [Nocardia aurantia]|uniref:Ester cyclase n=1 Tax=Nocardia aurantia TaxID=2585199 RepID=A0A7K0DS02_9NOCA|nr:ester cyclase [Nocardia aurantia]MQY28378.1 hypothetical protein [Nocardia aurantia]